MLRWPQHGLIPGGLADVLLGYALNFAHLKLKPRGVASEFWISQEFKRAITATKVVASSGTWPKSGFNIGGFSLGGSMQRIIRFFDF